MNGRELEASIFDLVGYMITSARNLLDETPLYGPFRLVDAASRLISILEVQGLGSDRLGALRAAVDNGKYSVMREKEEFATYLDDLVERLIDHAAGANGGDE
jgi:hypothetical protein